MVDEKIVLEKCCSFYTLLAAICYWFYRQLTNWLPGLQHIFTAEKQCAYSTLGSKYGEMVNSMVDKVHLWCPSSHRYSDECNSDFSSHFKFGMTVPLNSTKAPLSFSLTNLFASKKWPTNEKKKIVFFKMNIYHKKSLEIIKRELREVKRWGEQMYGIHCIFVKQKIFSFKTVIYTITTCSDLCYYII